MPAVIAPTRKKVISCIKLPYLNVIFYAFVFILRLVFSDAMGRGTGLLQQHAGQTVELFMSSHHEHAVIRHDDPTGPKWWCDAQLEGCKEGGHNSNCFRCSEGCNFDLCEACLELTLVKRFM